MLSNKAYKTQLEKVQRAQENARRKQRFKYSDPVYLEKVRSKQKKAQEKGIQKQQAKYNSPEFKLLQCKKQKEAAKRQQEKTKKKNNFNRNINPTPRANKIKSRGLLGRSRTAQEKHLENLIGKLGCIVCYIKGWHVVDMAEEPFISLHHTDGRTKSYCHAKQIPLCKHHHDTPIEEPKFKKAYPDLFPFHGGGKKRWEAINGTQEELLVLVYELIGEKIPWLDAA